MRDISVKDLQDIAVRCTSNFYNSNIPLSESLAKEASANDLNSEQLKRALEATNTLAYLQSLQLGGDRTGEFPLADYGTVVKMASVPELPAQTPSFTKAAAAQESVSTVDPLAFQFPELGKREALFHFQKLASANKRSLYNATGHADVVASKIVKVAAEIKADPQGVGKLSASCTQDEFTKLSALVYGHDGLGLKYQDFAEHVYASKDLTKVAELKDLIEEGRETLKTIEKCAELARTATNVENVLVKQSFLGLVAEGAGALVRGVAGLAGKAVSATGGAAVSGAKAVGNVVANKVSSTGIGQALGVPAKPITPETVAVGSRLKRVGAGTVALGSAGLDVASFQPKVDPINDKSGDVWSALHG